MMRLSEIALIILAIRQIERKKYNEAMDNLKQLLNRAEEENRDLE